MAGIPIILIFFLTIAGMILALSKLRIHPFVTILAVSLILGILSGIPLTRLPAVIGAGFSSIFSGIGIVVIFGILIGGILEATGGAMKIADMMIKLVGKGSPTLAFMLMGWVVSLSVYNEAGFVALNPIRKSTVKYSGTSSVATAMGLGSGLYISHVLIPFTPGPIAASGILDMGDSLLLVLIVAIVVSIPALVGAYFYAIYIGKKKRTKEDIKAARDARAKSYGRVIKKHRKLPNGLLSLSPLLAPILLKSLGATAGTFGWTGLGADIAVFMGSPVIAMVVGLLFAVALLVKTRRMKDFNPVTEATLKMAGPILCVMGAGGVLGRVIMESGVVEFITADLSGLYSLGLFFPFLIAAVIKTAQGSSTIAMITTAGIMAPLMAPLGLGSAMMSALTVMAIGAGSMIVSHANDPYFWVVTRLSGISPRNGHTTQTMTTLVAGVSCMVGVFVFSLFVG
ncbi:MAG: GntP family permease [Treponema sp.]|nr:GntP family permease [Treponema sp.]